MPVHRRQQRGALTIPMSLRDLVRDLAMVPDEERLNELEADLSAETTSTRLRPGLEAIWSTLRSTAVGFQASGAE